MADTVDSSRMDIGMMIYNCQFLKQNNIDESTNVGKIFILYCWDATNIYLIRDKNNDCKLPECLVHKMCGIYPNPKGDAYIGNEK